MKIDYNRQVEYQNRLRSIDHNNGNEHPNNTILIHYPAEKHENNTSIGLRINQNALIMISIYFVKTFLFFFCHRFIGIGVL